MRGAHLVLPVLLALGALAAAPGALAYPELDAAQSAPPPNARAQAGLSEVLVRFTDPLDPRASSVEVVRTDSGEVMNAGDAAFLGGGAVVRVPVAPLDDGIYTVRWRALSAADGHDAHGAYLFAVGGASLGPTAPPPVSYDAADYDASGVAREGAARAAFYGGLLLAVGVPLFALVVLRGEPVPPRLLGSAAAFAAAAAVAAAVMVPLLAQRIDRPLAEAAATVVGASWLRRGALLLLAAGALAVAATRRRPAIRRGLAASALLLAALALVLTSLAGHAAAADDAPRALAVATDALHLLTGAVWLGGVVGLLHAGWGRAPADLARLARRLMPMAAGSLALLAATGAYAATLHVPRLADLWLDPYGRLVAAKLLLAIPLLLLLAHGQRLLSARPGEAPRVGRHARRVLQVEAAVLVVALAVTGALAASAPPRAADDADAQPPSDDASSAFQLDRNTRRAHVVLEVRPDPPSVGTTNVTVLVHTAQMPEGTQVRVAFEPPASGAADGGGAQPVALDRTAADAWSAEGAFLTAPGTWRLHVTIAWGGGIEPETITFDVPVAPRGGDAGDATTQPGGSTR